MKFWIIGIVSALIGGALMVVQTQQANAQVNLRPLCALASPSFDPNTDITPTTFAMQQMSQVNQVLCSRFICPNYKLIQNSNAGNAMAMMFGNQYVIRYNPNFMNSVISSFGELATIGIFAHELGHLIDFIENSLPVSRQQREARADEFAGCAFALAGNPIDDLSASATVLHQLGPSLGYPTPDQRVQLLIQGYNKCK